MNLKRRKEKRSEIWLCLLENDKTRQNWMIYEREEKMNKEFMKDVINLLTVMGVLSLFYFIVHVPFVFSFVAVT
jgi:hypothetical protein